MRLRYFITGLIFLVSSITFGQSKLIGYTYSMSVPLEVNNDYITSWSFRGVTFEGLIELNERLAAGWLAGWNVFSEKHLNDIYVKDNVTINGTQYRYMNLFPILARAAYQFGKHSGTRPYIGAGLGTTGEISRTDIGLISYREDAWHLSISPETGINIPVKGGAITTSFRYIYGLKAQDIHSISYLSFNLGFLFGGIKEK